MYIFKVTFWYTYKLWDFFTKIIIRIINIPIISHNYHLYMYVMRTHKIYSFSKWLLLTIALRNLFILQNWNFVCFWAKPPHLPRPPPMTTIFYPLFSWVQFFLDSVYKWDHIPLFLWKKTYPLKRKMWWHLRSTLRNFQVNNTAF